ncbi:hypothetical protein FGSG_07647 [Fusarium graminearum PH-1]|uniref:hypothetical protein n=1 Tax=Gibberella zeae (strain ATCC MYA-4620 / CBS 123657 / FGSC 9075 / NRRL 31084 / PH-1) TaxID=229533 RepID=UPI000023DF4E|nr:hypothetical protein FGSG_07647 [Fusarium graminearum PH-1]ESU13927.1 hypothetical protein FGSG_07647 [Fusarium graminearum PH-1]|eukprot:XP_011327434.1 hypothetical protein FGSG_07647 [Fusarium graminearum PH-1]
MYTAPGILTLTGSNRMTLTFIIDDVHFTLTGNINPAMPPFKANQVILTYNNVHELSSTVSFEGQIGPNNFKLNLENGVTAEGYLDFPISPASRISGSGRRSNCNTRAAYQGIFYIYSYLLSKHDCR